MGVRNPRFDAYIAGSAEFARPILTHIRAVVHEACPDVEEEMKWSTPHFTYRGMLCAMAAFKAHCAFGFWKGSLVLGGKGAGADEAAGQFGRVTKLSDLPSRTTLKRYIRKAMELNEQGVAVKRAPARAKPPLKVPKDLAAALGKSARARKTFDGFPPSHQREYVEWITEAKAEETRKRRLDTAIEWMAEGKSRNWKYQK